MSDSFTPEQLERFRTATYTGQPAGKEEAFSKIFHNTFGIALLHGLSSRGDEGRVLREDISTEELDSKYQAATEPLAFFESMLKRDRPNDKPVTRQDFQRGLQDLYALLAPDNTLADEYRRILETAAKLLDFAPLKNPSGPDRFIGGGEGMAR